MGPALGTPELSFLGRYSMFNFDIDHIRKRLTRGVKVHVSVLKCEQFLFHLINMSSNEAE